MKQRGCTPDIVDALMSASSGPRIDTRLLDDFDDMDSMGVNTLTESLNLEKSDLLKEPPEPWMGGLPDWLNPVKAVSSVSESLGGLITDTRNWSGLLGEDYIAPLQEFLESHFAQYGDDLNAGRSDYFSQIDDVLDSLDDSGLSSSQLRLAEKYKTLYGNGGVFYNKEGGIRDVAAIGNIVGNTIQSSPTVIMGNPLELSYKLPAIYPKETIPAIQRAMKEGLFKRIPEIEARGGYGSSVGAANVMGDRKAFEGLIGLTDIPAKNITYFAGELASPGGGIKAIQDIMFVPRFADVPAIYHSGMGGATIGLLSYTINTYKLIGGLMGKAVKGDMTALASLATMYGIAGTIGGLGSESGNPFTSALASGMPAPLQSFIEAAIPDSEEFFDENTGKLAGLVKPGSIDRVGIPFSIASRQLGKGLKAGMNSVEEFGEGDYIPAIVDLGDAILSALPFGTGSVLNDMQFQKVKDMAVDAFKGDLDFEDIPGEALDKFTPYPLKD